MKASGYAWPVIDMHIRYLQPAAFGDRIKVRAELVEWENRLKLQYLITSVATGLRLTKATTVQVAVELSANQMCLASPPVLFEKLGLPLP
jgi:acyl-CoA thioester hydrolase